MAAIQYFGQVRPCPKCPFRTDVPKYIRPGRAAEIAAGLLRGGSFTCHETTVDAGPDGFGDESDMVDGPKARFCAGALITMEKADAPNQLMRSMEAVGGYDASRLDMAAPVYGGLTAWVDSFLTDDPEFEHCGVVGPGCADPAGYSVGGGAVPNTDEARCGPEDECQSCGNRMCGSCRGEDGLCVYCAGDDAGVAG